MKVKYEGIVGDGTEPWHGTATGYAAKHCKCVSCKAWQKEYCRVRYVEKLRDRWLQQQYGIAEDAWTELFEAQGKKCVFGCERPGSVNGWHTDHDHTTGKVRGILCMSHNMVLGHIEKYRHEMDTLLEYIDSRR